MLIAIAALFGGIVLSTLIASAAVAPFAAYHFHKSQQYAMLANLIAIPICNIVVMPAALATLMAMPFGLEWAPLQVMGLGIQGMVWCAYQVAALPGAVGRIPAIPVSAFALMIAGGTWLALWRTRWRLAGLAPVALGAAIAPWQQAPDVLVGRDGTLVAVRTAKGELSAVAPRSGMFELARWLEHDGDARTAEAAAKSEAFRCDAAGCVAVAKGRQVALPRHASALRDDCAAAAILVLALPALPACKGAGLTITREALRTQGAHALFLNGDAIRVETVADRTGRRPWSARLEEAPREPDRGSGETLALGRRPDRSAARSRHSWRTGEAPSRRTAQTGDDEP
jgi:competence protein ComEC